MNILTTVLFVNSICFGISPKEIPLNELKPFTPIVVDSQRTQLNTASQVIDGFSIHILGIDWSCSWRKDNV